MYRETKIDHFVFAIDHGSWRSTVYPAYKSRRKLDRLSAPPAKQAENAQFAETLDQLVTYLDQETRCTVLDAQRVEGDDFIARWIDRHPNDRHLIISGDSDFVQLISPSVSIFDASNQRHISIDEIVDEHGKRHVFTVSPKDGKIKIGVTDPAFIAEQEWWRKALFIKLMRGDASDSVFSAYPGVRYEGKKCSIRAAWDDRREQSYDWNNMMFQTWKKLIGSDASGEPITETVRVIDEYRINQSLIDLTMQPVDILTTMDQTIAAAIAQPLPAAVGIGFLRFCTVHDQPSLAKEANDHVTYLNAAYPGRPIS
jgi:hypothetical protein